MASSSDEKKAKNTRTRSGCVICRKRKVKCDQRRPGCANCLKTKRECDYGEGSYRHHHNAGINENLTDLPNYFNGSNSYSGKERDAFLPVPSVSWTPVQTPNNFEDAASGRLLNINSDASTANAQQTATHGLEALSAAAAGYDAHAADSYTSGYLMNNAASTSDAIDPNLSRGFANSGEEHGREVNNTGQDDTVDEQLVQALKAHTNHAGAIRNEGVQIVT